jgi:hypothetical protein
MARRWFETYLGELGSLWPRQFLAVFVPIHQLWYDRRDLFDAGFLMFYRAVLREYAKSLGHVGLSLPAPWSPTDPTLEFNRTLLETDSPRSFSQAVELWHQEVCLTGGIPNLGDPKLNVYIRKFWAFHRFVDDQYGEWLARHPNWEPLAPDEHRFV